MRNAHAESAAILLNPRAILSSSVVFDSFQSLVGAPRLFGKFLDYVRPQAGQHLLDIGCGVGATLRHLPGGVRYTGIDISPAYIDAARERFGDRGRFIATDVGEAVLPRSHFDCAIAVGVMHHLNNQTAHSMLKLARHALRPGGSLYTVDPCYTADQSSIGRWITSKDRGQFVRDLEGYRRLFDTHGRTETSIVKGLLRIPYTHIVAKVDFAA